VWYYFKLKFPDLEENCANYDILCFFESKIDVVDEIEFSGFVKLPPLNRKNLVVLLCSLKSIYIIILKF
jgi:hypothetical protein